MQKVEMERSLHQVFFKMCKYKTQTDTQTKYTSQVQKY